jgi:hypothetical protein
MRNISFSLTTPQFIAGTKDVTRRFGWWNVKPGEHLRAVRKAMGLKKGEKMEALGVIEIISARAERLDAITPDDCRREGFPEFGPEDFIRFLCKDGKHDGGSIVNRIEFRKISEQSP